MFRKSIKHEEENLTFVALLKACAKKKDIERGTKLHMTIVKKGLLMEGSNLYLASTLIYMYAKCGAVSKAHKVLEDLLVRDVVIWNALISGYAQTSQQGFEALDCYQRMQCEGISPNVITFVCILKACGSIQTLEKGKQIHESILNTCVLDACTSDAPTLNTCINNKKEDVVMVGTSLVGMYVKCGVVDEAEKVLEGLRFRNVVTWNALITGYVHQGLDHQAMNCFERMQKEGLSPNEVTFICILKSCGNIGCIEKGEEIYEEIMNRGILDKDITVGNALVNMYAKCGMLAKARDLLEDLPFRDKVSWNVIISKYVQQGQCHEAMNCYESMKREGLSPDRITYICILNACAKSGAIEKGQEIYEQVSSMGLLEKDIVVGNALIDMYAKCGQFEKAHKGLEELPIPNVVSWNALISGYVHQGLDYEALKCFECMRNEGLSPDAPTFLSIFKACGSTKAIEKGKYLHVEVLSRGFLVENDTIVGSAVVDMYVKCGVLEKAQQVLEDLALRDVVTWSAIIAGYAQQGQDHESMDCFERMQREGLFPNAITFICILHACGKTGAIEKGKYIHEEVVRRGLLNDSISLANALIDMYAKCGVLVNAKQLLEELLDRDIISWNALIEVYANQGQGHQALDCLDRIQSEGLLPDDFTFICILRACGSSECTINKGKQVHSKIICMGLLDKNIVLGTALVDMYAKYGFLEKAEEVLWELPLRNVVSWNALITGYVHQGQGHEALNSYEQMQVEGHSLDIVTFICTLKACGNIGAIAKGEEIHDEIVRRGLLKKDALLGTTLMEMYLKCDMFMKAEQVLEELPIRDVITWSTLISGYAQQGLGHKSLKCFVHMQSEGFTPDKVTLLSVLSACSHSGLMSDAHILFWNMTEKYGLIPDIKHHTCMVMVFGHGGHFDDAISMINIMPSLHNPSIWLALLGACRKWATLELGRLVFDQVVQVSSSHGGCIAAAYVLMANIFVASGMKDDAKKLKGIGLEYRRNVLPSLTSAR